MLVVRKADVRVVPSAARAAEQWAALMAAYLAGNWVGPTAAWKVFEMVVAWVG